MERQAPTRHESYWIETDREYGEGKSSTIPATLDDRSRANKPHCIHVCIWGLVVNLYVLVLVVTDIQISHVNYDGVFKMISSSVFTALVPSVEHCCVLLFQRSSICRSIRPLTRHRRDPTTRPRRLPTVHPSNRCTRLYPTRHLRLHHQVRGLCGRSVIGDMQYS